VTRVTGSVEEIWGYFIVEVGKKRQMKVDRSQIVVVGGGPAGMMAAIKGAMAGCSVTLLEKNALCGRKLCLTGKGRCNLTNTKKWSEFATHIHPVSNFVKPAFFNFSNEQTMAFFESIGLPLSIEQGERVFPKSMKAVDVANVMVEQMLLRGVNVVNYADVDSIEKVGETFKCSYFLNSKGKCNMAIIYADAVIVATGGLSYPVTGSTGEGYDIAKGFGHSVTQTFPSLTALMPTMYDTDLIKLELKNVGLTLIVDYDTLQVEQGDLTFTDNGIEGSLGYRVSRRAVKALINGQRVSLDIDLKPALSNLLLSRRIEREVERLKINPDKVSGPKMKEILLTLLPRQAVQPFIRSNNDLTLANLPERLKRWHFPIISYTGYERSVVTAGGVSQKEIIAKSMCSKLVPGLFFAGEVLDVDGDTGGYNLQVAFSTGTLAGQSAVARIQKDRLQEK